MFRGRLRAPKRAHSRSLPPGQTTFPRLLRAQLQPFCPSPIPPPFLPFFLSPGDCAGNDQVALLAFSSHTPRLKSRRLGPVGVRNPSGGNGWLHRLPDGACPPPHFCQFSAGLPRICRFLHQSPFSLGRRQPPRLHGNPGSGGAPPQLPLELLRKTFS